MKLADITDITVDVVKQALKVLKPYDVTCCATAWFRMAYPLSPGTLCTCCPLGAVALAASIENSGPLPVELNGRIRLQVPKPSHAMTRLTALSELEERARQYLLSRFSLEYQDGFTHVFDTGKPGAFFDPGNPDCVRGAAAGGALRDAYFAGELNTD